MGFFKNRFNKVGPGVSKDEKPKRRFFLFFELFGRNFWKIITVNLLFVLCSIPIITIGPALAGLTHVLRNLSNEEQSFVVSDFFEQFKINFKQSLPAGLIKIIVGLILLISTSYYGLNLNYNKMFYILFTVAAGIDIIFIFSYFYIYLMIVSLELKLKHIYKNAFIFSIIGLKNNFITIIALGLVLFILYLFVPVPIILILYIIILPAAFNFLIVFNSYPVIKKHAIDPYYLENEINPPTNINDDIENIFIDKGETKSLETNKKDEKKSTEL